MKSNCPLFHLKLVTLCNQRLQYVKELKATLPETTKDKLPRRQHVVTLANWCISPSKGGFPTSENTKNHIVFNKEHVFLTWCKRIDRLLFSSTLRSATGWWFQTFPNTNSPIWDRICLKTLGKQTQLMLKKAQRINKSPNVCKPKPENNLEKKQPNDQKQTIEKYLSTKSKTKHPPFHPFVGAHKNNNQTTTKKKNKQNPTKTQTKKTQTKNLRLPPKKPKPTRVSYPSVSSESPSYLLSSQIGLTSRQRGRRESKPGAGPREPPAFPTWLRTFRRFLFLTGDSWGGFLPFFVK